MSLTFLEVQIIRHHLSTCPEQESIPVVCVAPTCWPVGVGVGDAQPLVISPWSHTPSPLVIHTPTGHTPCILRYTPSPPVDRRNDTYLWQECIPIGCVLPACCLYLPACNALGVCVCTCPGGCTCLGVYLPRGCTCPMGVYLPGGLPARGWTCPGGVPTCPGGCTCPGKV